MTPDCLWLIWPAFVYQISISRMFEGSYFKMRGWPSRKRSWQQRWRLRACAPAFKPPRPLMNCLSQTNDMENTRVIMELKKKTHFPKQHHHQSITFWILKPATTTLKHSQIDTLELKKKKKTKHNNTLIFKNLRLTLPGQGAVLLQTLDSLKGPLQCVPYGETHVLVRTCDPWPHVTEHELHWDHSSAPDSPVWEKGDTS